jgi:hypothetical protein
MKAGHFSGFVSNLTAEDTAVLISMGPIPDRRGEHLSSSDKAIGFARLQLIQAARDFQAGKAPASAAPEGGWANIRSRVVYAAADQDWRPMLRERPARRASEAVTW